MVDGRGVVLVLGATVLGGLVYRWFLNTQP